MPDQNPRTSARDQLREYRRIVASAVAELRSAEQRNSLMAFTLETAVDQQIELLTGTADPNRRSRLQRVDKVKDDLLSNLQAIRNTPPEWFRRADTDGDANTPQTPEE